MHSRQSPGGSRHPTPINVGRRSKAYKKSNPMIDGNHDQQEANCPKDVAAYL